MSTRQPSLLRKAISVLASFALAVAFVPIAWATEGAASITVSFRSGSETLGHVEIKNGEVWTTYSESDTKNAEAVKICPNEGYSVDWTGICLRVDGTDILTPDIQNQLTSGSGYALTAGTEYALEAVEFRNGGGGSPGPESGDPAHGGYEGEQKTASVTVTGKADFCINDSRMVNANDGDRFDDVRYHYDGKGYVDFYFNCFITERITALKINGEDYFGQLPTPKTEEGKAALLAACKGQLNEFKITVPYRETGYSIISNVKWLDDNDKDYMVVGNFLWTYTDKNQGDDYIDHGRMELIKVSYKDVDYGPEQLNNPGTGFDWSQDENGGSAVLPVGAVVTVKLVPDYGYQLTSFGINGGDFGTGDEQSVFTFEIMPGNAHLGAHFTPVADKVTSTAQSVSEGSISLGKDLAGGSAELKIAAATLSADKEAAFLEAVPEGFAVADYLNLDMYNIYYKGKTTEEGDPVGVWEQGIDSLGADATISMELSSTMLADGLSKDDVVLVHNIHDANDFETIPVDSYYPETSTVTFKTDSFSAYAIAVKKTASSGSTTGGGSYVPAPQPQPETPPITNTGSGDSTSTTVDVTDKVTTTETGATQVAVDADLGTKIVENAVANKVADVVIKAETTAGASTETAVALPASTVKELAEKTEASVTISTDSAQVTLDKAAVAAVAEQAGDAGSVQLVVQTSEQNKNKVQIEITLQTSNGNVSDFRGGSVRISVPVSEELAAKKIVCVYIDANGKYTKMPGALSADGKSYVFSTGHFSTYAVMTEEEANAAIAEQEKAEAAALAAAKPAAPNVKLSSPAKGKLTVKASAKKAKGYRVYYKKAGWKAYKTYTTSGTVKALSKTFKKLSKGSYTVKVRAFGKTAAGKIAWGAKSKAKKVAVK